MEDPQALLYEQLEALLSVQTGDGVGMTEKEI